MNIKLFNTMSRKLEDFKPLVPGKVGFYSCGPTVYHYTHIGNLRSFVLADLLKRMFIENGYDVYNVMNITDVGHLTSDDDDSGEDKMEKGRPVKTNPSGMSLSFTRMNFCATVRI